MMYFLVGEYWTEWFPFPRKCDQAAAVEIDAIEMDKVRILILILCRGGRKPNLAVLLRHTIDAANNIITFVSVLMFPSFVSYRYR